MVHTHIAFAGSDGMTCVSSGWVGDQLVVSTPSQKFAEAPKFGTLILVADMTGFLNERIRDRVQRMLVPSLN